MTNWNQNADPTGWASTEWVRALFNQLQRDIAGVNEFIELTDAPSSYSGAAGMIPIVNAGQTGLGFGDIGLSGAITVDAVTTAALAANTYANGAAGVGATITINGNGAFPTIDTVTAGVGKLYLIKNETGSNRIKNGVYTLTTLGTAGTQAVLTRTTSSDAPSEFDNQIVFAAYTGGTNGRKYFIQTTVLPTIGTNNIIYVQNKVGGTQSLSQTLTIGDTAAGLNITNVGLLGIGKTPTIALDVIGNARISNATYPTNGLFSVTEATGEVYIGDGTNVAHDVNGTNIHLKDSLQRIALVVNVPATAPTGTAGVYIGEATGFGYAGFTAGYGNDNKEQGTYTVGRPGTGGAYITVQDANDTTGSITNTFQATGNWIAQVVGAVVMATIDAANTTFNIGSTGVFFAGLSGGTEGFKADFAGGTANGIYTVGGGTGLIVINDALGVIEFQSTGLKAKIDSTGLLVDNITELTPAGGLGFKSTLQFLFNDGGGNNFLNINTSTGQVTIGDASSSNALLRITQATGVTVLGDWNNNNNGTKITITDFGATSNIDLKSTTTTVNGNATGSGTIDTAVTPNLVFENGLFKSAS